jgi:hypothetical protein
MTVKTETIHQGEFLLSEANGHQSRDVATVTVVGTSPYLSGTVLGKVTASGKLVKYADGNSDGSQTAVGVLWNELPGVAGDVKATVITRNAEVIGAKLTGLDANGTADLKALGIIVR